jgi:hypothetical protein
MLWVVKNKFMKTLVGTVPLLLFRQAWATMIDVEGGANPIIKDTALDSKGAILKVPKCEILMSWILIIFLSSSLYR